VICSLQPLVQTISDLIRGRKTMQPTPTSGSQTIRVLVADDTRIHTQLLADALRRDLQLEVISPPAQSRDLVAAVEAVNAAPEYMIGKRLVAEGKAIAAETLADISISMKQMV